MSEIRTIECIVDNRTLILALDELYRQRMQSFEVNTLLPAAKTVAKVLDVEPCSGPVEGYYAETEALTEYFQIMRALQQQGARSAEKVEEMPEFHQLLEVCNAAIYGAGADSSGLLPSRRDPLYYALNALPPDEWALAALTELAANIAREKDDYSLVGIASLSQEPLLITALRESCVLYAAIAALCAPDEPQERYHYIWKVDKEIADACNRFISEFNALTQSDLLPATEDNAEYFYDAAQDANITGRCVRIGYDDSVYPTRHYHWAINDRRKVEEFWSDELWTTERYCNEKLWP
ncbi:hypothetical protein EUZ85_16535 [Hahella sp. KA22]|uniref:hypothetical protein n=1 Tax=Hahella sp. KA22 TaxID=1628392 RepID=UPI000FDF2761|nr:hypothetical protein [Hahella sp. KA22]AZZ92244.1 hypothetical protein ENC22_13970 [Hahella sp. KA22]QAY55615.1 hypothetical protein EUZ85_16535 [Hahella sp. KA22]